MPDPEKTTTEPTLSEVVQTLVIDNKEIPITEAPTVLKNLESSLRSDYTKKMQDHAQERKKLTEQLKADKEWLNTHDPKIWHLYSPLVEGGPGYMGTEEQLRQFDNEEPDNSEPTVHTPIKRPLDVNPEIKMLREKVTELEAKQNKTETLTFNTETERVLSTATEFIKKYPYASERAVVKELGLFFLENSYRHPKKTEIEAIVKTHHDENIKIQARNQKGREETGIPTKPVTTTPGGKPVQPDTKSGKKVLRFDHEPDSLVKTIFERMKGG